MLSRRIAAALLALCAPAAFALQSTTTTMAFSAAQIAPGGIIAMAATVSGNTPTGTVKFYEGTIVLAEVPLVNATATFQTSAFVTPGRHDVLGAYQGDAANAPSSGPGHFEVLPPPSAVTSISPSHLPAGTLDALLWIRGTDFRADMQVTVNGEFVQSQVDSPRVVRAVLPASLLATPGSLSIVLHGDGTKGNPDAAVAFPVDAPGPPPLTVSIGTSSATASNITPHGQTLWLVGRTFTDGTFSSEFYESAAKTDFDSDGTEVYQTIGGTGMEIPSNSVFVVTDLASGAVRAQAPVNGGRRRYAFLPFNLVQGMRDGQATRLGISTPYTLLLWVRPGVAAWSATHLPATTLTPDMFVPLGSTQPAPAAFLPDDLIVAIGTDSYTYDRIGNYLPVADPGVPSLIVDDASVVEGNSGTSYLDFHVHLTSASSSAVSAILWVTGGTATSSDFNGSLSMGVDFQPGELVKTVSVAVNADLLNEPDETVLARLTVPNPAQTILLATAVGTIRNDDARPTISIADGTVVEGNGHGATSYPVTITLSTPRGASTEGSLRITGVTADDTDAFLGINTYFTISEGLTSTNVYVPIIADANDEDDETFTIQLSSTDAALGQSRATVTIIDDDDPPAVTFRPMVVREGTGTDTTFDLYVDVNGGSERPMSIDYDVIGGGTASTSDFAFSAGTLNLVPPNAYPPQSNKIPVTIRGDSIAEGPETLPVVFHDAANVQSTTLPAWITIADDDRQSPYAGAIAADRPYAWYRLDDAADSVIKDSSGNGRDGTYHGNVRHNMPGALATPEPAAWFAANAGYASLPGVWGGAGWTEFSVEAWVKIDTPADPYAAYSAAAQIFSGSSFLNFQLSTYSAGTVRMSASSGSSVTLSAPVISANEWHHAVLSVRSGASALYIDGVSVATSSATFGALWDAAGPTFGGAYASIDELAVYRKALTAAEVSRHYALRSDIVRADFDGNASTDLVLRNPAAGANALWLMNGTAYSSTVNLPYLPPDFRIEGTADFDADGQTDLLLRNYANGNNALWLMNGTAIKAIVNLPWLPTSPDFRFEGTADIDGDGATDILIRNYANGNDAAWLMHGLTFASVVNLPALPDTNYRMAGSGDFNADGKADIVWRNQTTGSDAVWLMNGTSLLSILNLPALPNTAYRFNGVADFDGDSKPDLVLRNYTTGANAIWLLDGGVLKSIVDLPTLPNTQYQIMGPR
jgi:hypothetical protein